MSWKLKPEELFQIRERKKYDDETQWVVLNWIVDQKTKSKKDGIRII